ncbi:MAG: DUF4270 family protein [Panacibacter sp.]
MKKQFVLFFLISASIITACTKIVTTDIGGSLIPPVDGINTKDTLLEVISKNSTDTVTRITTDDIHSLGYVDDPLFGKTTASINLQLLPSQYPFYFPVGDDSLYIDSVVMVLNYKGAWGDTSKDLELKVFRISNDDPAGNISGDTVYPSNYVVPVLDELTENNTAKTVKFSKLAVVDSTTAFKEPTINQIRIRLNPSFGTDLLKKYDTTNAYRNDSTFNDYIKGFQVVPQNTGNALMRIALTSTNNTADTNTKLALYFHYQSKDSAKDKFTKDIRYLRCYSNSASTNYIKHERTGTQAQTYLQASAASQDLIFIDANPGIYARIQIPGLNAAMLSNRIIHRAELVMEQVPDLSSDNDTYLTPPNLFLTPYGYVNDTLVRFTLPNDIQFSNSAVANLFDYGCYPVKKHDDISGRDISTYSFDMSRYTQGIVTRKDSSFNLILYAPVYDGLPIASTSAVYFASVATSASPLNYPATGRVRLGGGTSTTHKMRFHIVYSDLPK